MAWRVAKSLEVLRNQIDVAHPNRDKSSDGTIASEEHHDANPSSDHEANPAGVVTALDITDDPAHGVDASAIAEAIRQSKDRRVKYIIHNGRILSGAEGARGSPSGSHTPWVWRERNKGPDDHTEHVHISVSIDPSLYDDPHPWNLEPPAMPSNRQQNITATNFRDSEVAYADVAPGWNDRFGVSLPFRFPKSRPLVWVEHDGTLIRNVPIIDVGPWNITDDYWSGGRRPLVENQFANRTIAQDGRVPTNTAGIDVTIPLDKALRLDGKGTVNWGFEGTQEKPVAETIQQQPAQPAPKMDAFAASQILVALATELAKRQTTAPSAPKASDPFLSPIDKTLGGQTLVGWKTALSVLAYGVLSIFQALGMVGTATGPSASTTGTILTAVIGTLGGLGITAKFDRATNMLGAVAKSLLKGTEK